MRAACSARYKASVLEQEDSQCPRVRHNSQGGTEEMKRQMGQMGRSMRIAYEDQRNASYRGASTDEGGGMA